MYMYALLLQTWITQPMYSEYDFWCICLIICPCVVDIMRSKNFYRIHSWGDSLEEAFEQCAMGMFGYMTDTETVEPLDTVDVESEGQSSQLEWCQIVFVYWPCCCPMTNWTLHVSTFCTGDDMESLLYHFLDDWLYKFCADLFFVPRVCWSSTGSAFYFHFTQTWLVFFLPLCVLTTSPLGNQSLKHRQTAL